ncbi:MAG: hypothetical protein QNJ27_03730 [Simkaniaceae bacterium]|nr:hypothetical protein [Simkaniaceae bacterium]
MVRIGSGGGAGEFSIGSGDGQPLDKLSEKSSKIGKFVTSHTKGETTFSLNGRVTADCKAPDYLQAMIKRYIGD